MRIPHLIIKSRRTYHLDVGAFERLQVRMLLAGYCGCEFLYVDDLADACVFLMEQGVSDGIFNIGAGEDVTIRALAETVMEVIGFSGSIVFDAAKPDGTPRKLLDVSRLRDIGWQARTPLREGIALAYRDFVARHVG